MTFFLFAGLGIAPSSCISDEAAENTELHLCPVRSIWKLYGTKRKRKNKVFSLHESIVTGYRSSSGERELNLAIRIMGTSSRRWKPSSSCLVHWLWKAHMPCHVAKLNICILVGTCLWCWHWPDDHRAFYCSYFCGLALFYSLRSYGGARGHPRWKPKESS